MRLTPWLNVLTDGFSHFVGNSVGVVQFEGDVVADGESSGVLNLDVEL